MKRGKTAESGSSHKGCTYNSSRPHATEAYTLILSVSLARPPPRPLFHPSEKMQPFVPRGRAQQHAREAYRSLLARTQQRRRKLLITALTKVSTSPVPSRLLHRLLVAISTQRRLLYPGFPLIPGVLRLPPSSPPVLRARLPAALKWRKVQSCQLEGKSATSPSVTGQAPSRNANRPSRKVFTSHSSS